MRIWAGRWNLCPPSMTLTYLFFQSPSEPSFFISLIYPNLFFGFPLLQWKHAFRSLILKRSNKSTNSVSTSHHELQLSFLHVSPLSLLGTQFHIEAEIKTVETRLEDEVRWTNPHCYSRLLDFISQKWC